MNAFSKRASFAASGFMWLIFAPCQPAQAQAARIEQDAINFFGKQNIKQIVFYDWGMNDDCTVKRGFNVSVARLPKHGTVSLEKTNSTVNTTWINRRASAVDIALIRKCLGRPMPIISVFYTPKPGFDSFDALQVVTTSADRSLQRTVEIRIGIR